MEPREPGRDLRVAGHRRESQGPQGTNRVPCHHRVNMSRVSVKERWVVHRRHTTGSRVPRRWCRRRWRRGGLRWPRRHQRGRGCTTAAAKSKKHGKRLCYGCGAYRHMRDMCPNKSWANKCEVGEKRASSKFANQLKMDEPKASIKCNKVSHLSNTCKDFKKTRNKAQVATRRCYACNEVGHMIYEGHNKQNKDCSNKDRIWYNCRRKGHLSYDCPNGNMPKPNAYVFNDKLRRTTNGSITRQARYSSHASTRATWVPKHIATNSIGPNKSWVPKCA